MERREFIAGAGLLAAAGYAPSVPAADDEAAVKQVIKDLYSVFYRDRDKQKYRSLLTEDYLLLEKGEILDAEGDIKMMPGPGSDYRRTDAFEFRAVKFQGDTAYVVYFLKSEIVDTNHVAHNDSWLESVVLRRSAKGWRCALFHSTLIAKPKA
jgi:ketosteroid isomerase-like protein